MQHITIAQTTTEDLLATILNYPKDPAARAAAQEFLRRCSPNPGDYHGDKARAILADKKEG